ncbi:hypothetical protein N7466_005014 [Penicillium verhagenii]|uniref:uncharacterized protein n=1 Tax=Penicillium verhagenii TaxID=1562060 RepID=UPI0025452F18|nr:uncharacterized protein N7466_005014 [Penicillium verhagenii]KAJ5935467.1 hypothetical protein N7466_005014 [Penicillium verhagenii]
MQLLQSLAFLGAISSVSALTISIYPAESCETALMSWTTTLTGCVNIKMGTSVHSIAVTDMTGYEVWTYPTANCAFDLYTNVATTAGTCTTNGENEAIKSVKIVAT